MGWRKSVTIGLVCATALGVALAGCGGGGAGNTTGVTAKSVLIGGHDPLTGPAAPGYSEIAPAAKAFFTYINSGGGVNGRTIDYRYVDDAYNPTQTVTVVKQLVLSTKVFAIFNGLGTPTHTKVVDFLNSSKVPDLFVASGCRCWDQPSKRPETFGWQTDYVVEGKILGAYVKQHFAGKKIAYFFQNDDFGQGGVQGLDREIPKSQVVARQSYEPTNTNVAPQISAIQRSGAQVVVSFSIPAFTALAELTSFKLGYKPQLVVSNVGADPITLTGLLKTFSKGAAGPALIEGIVTDAYLPPVGETSNPWIKLFKMIHDKYDAGAPFDANVEYGMAAAYTFAQALQATGSKPTRSGIVKALENTKLAGPGLVPYRYSSSSHAGYTGVQIGTITHGIVTLTGTPMTTDDGSGPITAYTKKQPAPPARGVALH